MYNFKKETYIKIIFFFSIVVLVSAYFIEFVLEYQPCSLCLIERIPYGLCIILVILNYIFNKNEKFVILLLILTLAFSLILSFYHFGIEQGFLKESAVCDIENAAKIISKEDILKQLQEMTISCKDVTFRIFGLSLTTINMLVSLGLLTLVIILFKNYEKFKN